MYVNDLSFDPRDPLYEAPGLSGVRWGLQIFTTRNLYGLDPQRVSLTHEGEGVRLVSEGLSWAGQQQRARGRVEARAVWQDGALTWRVEARHDEPIKAIKLLLWGLPDAALGQGWWHPTLPDGEVVRPTGEQPLLWRYPWPEWLTSWACAGDDGGVCVSIRDSEVRAKRLYVYMPPYAGGKQVVELVCEEDARRWGGHFETPEMRLRACGSAGEVRHDFEEHLAFVEQVFGVPVWEKRQDVPVWFRDVRLVLNLHGQHWTGYVFNTFDRMAEALRFMTRHIDGKHLLAYLPGWEGRYYFAYPFYRPGEALGGDAGFRRLLATARELGVRVMPMFGMHGANAQLYPEWEQVAFRNRTDRYVELINRPDWDSDRSGEDDQVFLNTGEPVFRHHLLTQVSSAVAHYDLDGVFLDTSACWFNDPWHNLYDGYRALVAELRARHPNILIAGEGWYDALLALFPANQSWLGVDLRYRYPEVLTRYARALGHLMDGTPGTGSTGVHEGGFRVPKTIEPQPGHIPALGIADGTLEKYGEEVVRVCRKAMQRTP
jgi:hypothetical protein